MSVPYTSRIRPASARHAVKHARVRTGGTGGRGIDDALPPTVTNERPRSRLVLAKYSDSASSSRIVLTAAAPVKSPKPSMSE